MDGVVVIDKPAGMTSHDVVDRVRKVLGTRRVGHGGTLDPAATGVLLVGIGRATRFLQFAQGASKRYSVTGRFGTTTTTQDASGEIVARRDASGVVEDGVRAALGAFTGEIDQIPPMVSAVKVGGERLYRKARRGEEVERAARRIVIHDLDLVAFVPGPEPEATFDVCCSGGTYVRTLVHDLGEALGVGAFVVDLRRTEAGGFTLADAVPLDRVSAATLLPLAEVARDLPSVHASADEAVLVSHGRPLAARAPAVENAPVAVLHEGRLLGVYRRRGDVLQPERVVPQ